MDISRSVSLLGFFGTAAGGMEILVVLLAALVLFGPKQLPRLARTMGRILEQLRSASQEFRHQLMNVENELDAERLSADDASSKPELTTESGDGSSGLPGAGKGAVAGQTAPERPGTAADSQTRHDGRSTDALAG